MNACVPDLRAFLALQERSGRLQRVPAEVDKDRELACIARWALESTRAEDAYAILFERVRDHRAPVAVNLYTTHALYAAALGTTPERLLEVWAAALAHPKPPVPVAFGPVHEVVELGPRADLRSLPSPVWTPGRDAGPYLSAAAVITKDPDTGIQNLGTYRVQIHEGRRAGVFFGTGLQHGAMHYAKWRARNQAMPIAIVVGAPPVVSFAAAAKTAYGVDEMTIAGGLAGAGIEILQAATVDLMIPAQAECVIEGVVEPGAQRQEGPFGEALGYMNGPAVAPCATVSAITHRRDPIHHGYVQQLPPSEGHVVWEMGVLGPLWYYLTRQLRLAGIRDLAIARGSAGVAVLLVQIAGTHVSRAMTLGRTLAKINFGQKLIYLLDEDIDIHDLETVTWAISARVDPRRDITVIDGLKTFQADPSVMARAALTSSGIGAPPYESSLAIVDATLKGSVPELALPAPALMQAALDRWPELALPPITPRARLRRLLAGHGEGGARSAGDHGHQHPG